MNVQSDICLRGRGGAKLKVTSRSVVQDKSMLGVNEVKH